MPLFDYECVCGEVYLDKLVRRSDTVITCTTCGAVCSKRISMHAKTASAWEVSPVKNDNITQA